MKISTSLGQTTLIVSAASVLLAPCARADVDADFANQAHTYGIYGPRDYNAWVGKIACKRLANHVDETALESVAFLQGNLVGGTSQGQAWQFLGAAVAAYCPEATSVLPSAAGPSGSTMKELE